MKMPPVWESASALFQVIDRSHVSTFASLIIFKFDQGENFWQEFSIASNNIEILRLFVTDICFSDPFIFRIFDAGLEVMRRGVMRALVPRFLPSICSMGRYLALH